MKKMSGNNAKSENNQLDPNDNEEDEISSSASSNSNDKDSHLADNNLEGYDFKFFINVFIIF